MLYTYALRKTKTDAHELACSVCFPVPFDGGERRPGVLHFLRHIGSRYGLLVAQELYLLVPLVMTAL